MSDGKVKKLVDLVPPGTSVERARRVLLDNLADGVICACCNRLARSYREPIDSGMARSLIWLVRHYARNRGPWVEVRAVAPTYVLRSAKMGKLRRWGMVITWDDKPDDGRKRAGLYKPTRRAFDFCLNRIRVASHIITVNDEIVGVSDTMVNIQQALGKKFNYDEIFPPQDRDISPQLDLPIL